MYRSIFRTEMELRSVQELVKQQMKEQGEVANVSNRGSKPVEILPSFDRTGKFIDTQLRVSDDDGYSSSDELSEISAAADGRTCLQSDVSCARLLEDVMRQLEIFNEKLAIDRCATPRDRKAHKARVHWQASTRSRGSSGVTTTCNSTSTSTRTLETSTTTSSVSTGNSMRDSPIPDESTHGESRFAPCGRFVSSRKMFATRKQSDAAMRPPPKYQCHTHTRFPHIDSSSLARGVQKEKNHGINEISLLSGRSTDESVSTLVSPRERIRLASERSVSASVASPSVIYVKPTPIVVTKMLTGLFIDSPRSPTGTQRSSTSSFSSASSAFSSGFSSLSPSK